ncbi:MAG: hypothetical protein ACYTAO_18905 [Planctomycetota bacterium]|jgi:hypothetical protein
MPRGNFNQPKSNVPTWHFRVRGESRDGEMVTLGCYQTEKEAELHYDTVVKEGYYESLSVEPL